MKENNKKEYTQRGTKDIVWAIFLIFIGVIFLLNTTGVVGWGIWTYIFRFWPVFLILAGIKLMIGRSVVSEVVLSIVSLTIFILIGLFSFLVFTTRQVAFLPSFMNDCIAGNCGHMFFSSGATIEKGFVIADEELQNIEKRVVDLDIRAAKFEVTDNSSTDYISVNGRYSESFQTPQLDVDSSSDGTATITFETVTSSRIFAANNVSEFDIFLGRPSLLTDLNVDLGAGEGTITLDEIMLSNVDTKVGAGKLTINLSQTAIPTGTVTVDVGAGELLLKLPENVGYELTYDLGIGEISANGKEIATFAGDGENVRSSNYDTAENIVKLNATVGVGSLKITNQN